jgi:hypothetical protein
VAAAVCRGVVRVLVDWWRWGERAAIAAAVGVPWRCRGGAEQRPQGGVVGVGGGQWVCCGAGRVAVGRWWRGGMTEASGVPLRLWGGGGVAGAYET